MSNRIEPVVEKVKHRLKSALSRLEDQFSQDLDTLSTLGEDSGSSSVSFKEMEETLRSFSFINSQVDLLNLFIEKAAQFAPRVALFIIKEDRLHGWAARGFSDAFNQNKIKKTHLEISQFAELQRAVVREEQFLINFSDLSSIADVIKDFDGFVPFMSAFYPIEVRSKIAAVLYADSGSESDLRDSGELGILSYVAGLELTQITAKIKKVKDVKTRDMERAKPVPPPDPTYDTDDFPSSKPPTPSPPPSRSVDLGGEDAPEIQKAKRVARVLVSDLKLYHEKEVAQAQVRGGLYDMIKEDIQRSYQHFSERTKGLAPEGTNYFKDEMLRQLAEGNPKVLGDLPF